MSFIALVDCNNFFVSCERVFRPELHKKPVIVLSNNDGCIVSRSKEAKEIGLPMGGPFFLWKEKLEAFRGVACSSNFTLYGDLSHRVMQTLSLLNPEMEVYSIDEAFLDLKGVDDPIAFAHHIRQTVLQWTGIPVSVGIGPTKTLAKAANEKAKKEKSGVFALCQEETIAPFLEMIPVDEIWGIGRRWKKLLAKKGIFSAADLRNQEDEWIRGLLSVVGLRIVWELRGISCLKVEELPSPKQSIMTSRSFSIPLYDLNLLEQAVAGFAARGGEKLREEGLMANWLQVFIMTSPHRDEPFYSNQASGGFSSSTCFTPHLIEKAKQLLKPLFRPGHRYKKAGVLLGGLQPVDQQQKDLFSSEDLPSSHQELMGLVDHVRHRWGERALFFGAEGTTRPWKGLCSLRSSHFTTSWQEILTIEMDIRRERKHT